MQDPQLCLGRATVVMACSSFSSLKRKETTNQQYFLRKFLCSHKFHQVFTQIGCLPHRKCSCLSLPLLLNNVLQIPCKQKEAEKGISTDITA